MDKENFPGPAPTPAHISMKKYIPDRNHLPTPTPTPTPIPIPIPIPTPIPTIMHTPTCSGMFYYTTN